MADVFISYKQQRKLVAEFLSELFEAHGFSVWYDKWLLTGTDFPSQIEPQIHAATTVLILWCPLARESVWVKNEASLAEVLGKNLDVKVTSDRVHQVFPLGKFEIQHCDLSDWTGDPCDFAYLDKLITDLEGRIGRSAVIDRQKLVALAKRWQREGRRKLVQFELGRDREDEERNQRTIASVAGAAPVLDRHPIVVPPPPLRPFLPGEEERWIQIEDSDDVIDFIEFADEFPGGRMEEVARATAAKLRDRHPI